MKTTLFDQDMQTVDVTPAADSDYVYLSRNTGMGLDSQDDDDDDDNDDDDNDDDDDDDDDSDGNSSDDSSDDDSSGDHGSSDSPIVTEDGTIVFGYSSYYIEGRSTQVTTQSTTLGILTAKANLFTARTIDSTVSISILNAGSISGSIGSFDAMGNPLPPSSSMDSTTGQDGGITQTDIEAALESNYGLVLLNLTREELLRVIEHGVSADDSEPAQFPQVSGLVFSYDPSLPAGQRVRSLAIANDDGNIVDVIVQDGVFIQNSVQSSYRIVTTDYLANGGDGYIFPEFTTTYNRVNLTEVNVDIDITVENNVANFTNFGTQQDALAEYLFVNHGSPTTVYNVEETTIEQDIVIQNVQVRQDTVVDINTNTFIFVGGNAKDRLFGGNLADQLSGGGGRDRLVGRDGDDDMQGGRGNDRVICGKGDDKASGNGGGDRIICGDGDDEADGQNGSDRISGGKGNDLIIGGNGNDRLFGGKGDDTIFGGKGNDFIVGGKGNDTIFGGKGNDILIANKGSNILNGGVGNDRLVGGKDDDTFVISEESGTTTILKFDVDVDILQFRSFTFEDLTITQFEQDTLIQIDNQILSVLIDVDATVITSSIVVTGGVDNDNGDDDNGDDDNGDDDNGDDDNGDDDNDAGSLCDRFGKPEALTFDYEPGTDVITGQKPNKATVNGEPDDDDLAYIVVSSKKVKNNKTPADYLAKGKTYFEGEVVVGEAFTADIDTADTKKFKSKTFIHLFDDEQAFLDGDRPLQTMEYHTSCSQAIALGDTIGSVELVAYSGESGSAVL